MLKRNMVFLIYYTLQIFFITSALCEVQYLNTMYSAGKNITMRKTLYENMNSTN